MQQVRADVLCTDGVGLCLLVVFAQLVLANGHRRRESDDETEKRQIGGYDNSKIVALAFLEFQMALETGCSGPFRRL